MLPRPPPPRLAKAATPPNPVAVTDLNDVRGRVRTWLMEQALPLWAERGADADGRFYELLDFDARPVLGGARRTRVQARQIYVFCEGADLGWTDGLPVARRGLDGLIVGSLRDDGLWVLSTDDAGRVVDETADLYDQAFVLFALAAAHRVLGDARALPLARRTVQAIHQRMAADHGGWAEALPHRLPRRQNPHMHLLEAMLAWQVAAPEDLFADTAKEVLRLFERHFFDPAHGVLGEFFEPDWAVAPGEPGRIVEPGHHFEWVWLLAQAKKNGWIDASEASAALYRTAMERGLNTDGFAVREIGRDGGIIDGGWRLWAGTEALRAHLTVGDEARAVAMAEAVFDRHLATDVPGLWMDSYHADGRPADAVVPASTLYHLMTPFTELLRGAS